jgi:hypothetical protein
MKQLFTFFLLTAFAVGASAQLTLPATFEIPEEDTAWNQFANAGDDPANFILAENPDYGGINTSDYCMQFNVLENADPWVGAWSDAYAPVVITADKYMMEMWVYKDVISNCGLKLEAGTTDNLEVKVPNTVTGEWEVITFDMSAAIGNSFDRLVFFPDFPDAREGASVCYIDNIGFVEPVGISSRESLEVRMYPSPARARITVEFPGMHRATISNIVGQQVLSLELGGVDSRVMDLSGLTPGLYFLSVETGRETASTKFLKE